MQHSLEYMQKKSIEDSIRTLEKAKSHQILLDAEFPDPYERGFIYLQSFFLTLGQLIRSQTSKEKEFNLLVEQMYSKLELLGDSAKGLLVTMSTEELLAELKRQLDQECMCADCFNKRTAENFFGTNQNKH